MRTLTETDILKLWEWGQGQHFPLEKGLNILHTTCPELSWVQLEELPVGQRDAMLISVRENMFGSRFRCIALCPSCSEELEFQFYADDIRTQSTATEVMVIAEQNVNIDGYKITFRLPTSQDLIALMDVANEQDISTQLLERCIVKTSLEDKPVDWKSLPDDVISELIEHMLECDPQAETLLDIDCTSCGHQWQILFDINEYFWIELSEQAKRILQEVYMLANAFCWHEKDILAMSIWRRHRYLEML